MVAYGNGGVLGPDILSVDQNREEEENMVGHLSQLREKQTLFDVWIPLPLSTITRVASTMHELE
jgi:hypothetical protein